MGYLRVGVSRQARQPGVDSALEQYKPETTLREMLAVGAARREAAVPHTRQVHYPDALSGRCIGQRTSRIAFGDNA